ncbi:MAG TPA: uracil-DNA glycosylase [Planctomycetaceae bacterium]|nr:uracil-DNA glycosylase [Planctomycetaceae bacterium]
MTREGVSAWDELNRRIIACRRCPRLRDYCRQIAVEKRRAYIDEEYWGRPVPNFGGRSARLLIVGLAPGAHGANRTGRMFTGDRSGDWLYRALYKAGFASQPDSKNRDDGLRLADCAITATCHCAPPDNRPAPAEIAACHEWFTQTVDLSHVRVFVALGRIAWRTVLEEARRREWWTGPLPQFRHAAEVQFPEGRFLVASFHPSQQNTFTGRLTEAMLDAVFKRARDFLSNS